MIMQQEKNNNDDEKDVSLIEYENIIMINKHEINDYKNIAIIKYKDVRYKNIQKEEKEEA